MQDGNKRPAGQGPSHATSSMVPIICLFTTILEGFDVQAAGVEGPRILAAFKLDPSSAGLIFAASPLGLLIGALLGGIIGDHRGRKAGLVCAVALFGTFTIGTAFAWDTASLFAMRLLTGIGLGAGLPNLMAVASEHGPRGLSRSFSIAMWAGMPLGGAIAAQIAQWSNNWQFVFLVGGIAPLFLVPLILIFLPDTKIVSNQETVARTRITDTLFGADRWRQTLSLWAAYFFSVCILNLLLNWLPLLLTSYGHPSQLATKAAFWFNIGGITGTLIFAALVRKMAPSTLLSGAFAGMTVCLIALALLGQGPFLAILLSFLAGALVIGSPFIIYGMTAALYPFEVRATAAGAAASAGRLGSVCGPLIVGQVLASGFASVEVIIGLAPLAVMAGISAFLCFREIEKFDDD